MKDTLTKFRHFLSSWKCLMIKVWFVLNWFANSCAVWLGFPQLWFAAQFWYNLFVQIEVNLWEKNFPIETGPTILCISRHLKHIWGEIWSRNSNLSMTMIDHDILPAQMKLPFAKIKHVCDSSFLKLSLTYMLCQEPE